METSEPRILASATCTPLPTSTDSGKPSSSLNCSPIQKRFKHRPPPLNLAHVNSKSSSAPCSISSQSRLPVSSVTRALRATEKQLSNSPTASVCAGSPGSTIYSPTASLSGDGIVPNILGHDGASNPYFASASMNITHSAGFASTPSFPRSFSTSSSSSVSCNPTDTLHAQDEAAASPIFEEHSREILFTPKLLRQLRPRETTCLSDAEECGNTPVKPMSPAPDVMFRPYGDCPICRSNASGRTAVITITEAFSTSITSGFLVLLHRVLSILGLCVLAFLRLGMNLPYHSKQGTTRLVQGSRRAQVWLTNTFLPIVFAIVNTISVAFARAVAAVQGDDDQEGVAFQHRQVHSGPSDSSYSDTGQASNGSSPVRSGARSPVEALIQELREAKMRRAKGKDE